MRIQQRAYTLLVLASAFTLSSSTARPQTAAIGSQPAGWNKDVQLSEAVDLNPDPKVVEVELEAAVVPIEYAPGERLDAWTYNGSLPGPLIRLNVGDRLIVHFSNKLPKPTTVHWHGLRIPASMDGVPGHSQPDVQPGGTFTYDFVVPDAGFYWYHPHVMSAAQVGFGLYGALLVEDPDDPVRDVDELVLVLSDLAVTERGAFESPDSGGTAGMLFGREGNRVLVNGHSLPRLTVRAGAPQRWRIVNAAKSRYFALDVGGIPFTIIGGDGGFLERPVENETLVIVPGERFDVIVTPRGEPGDELTVRSLLVNRGYGSTEYRTDEDLMTLKIADMPPYTGAEPPIRELRRAIEPVSTAGAAAVNIEFTVQEDKYAVNGVPFAHHRPVHATVGQTQVWTIKNSTKWSHPFHLHGFFFQVLDDSGQPVRPLAWKDTVDVPFEKSVNVVVRFDERPGHWMYHCHILDHADGGLMGMLELTDGGRHTAEPSGAHGP